jgi:DNA-binding response OmpR family regulator
MRILIVEDEFEIAETLRNALVKQKYFAVDLTDNGKSGFSLAQINEYDCLIVDIRLPEMNGIELIKKLRTDKNKVPILILSALNQQDDVNTGLQAGADDYLKKPFDFEELCLRIDSLVRRNTFEKPLELSYQDILLDQHSKRVFKNNIEILLNPKEYGILEYLLIHKGKVISQEELIEHVWDQNADFFTLTVRTNIKTLRQKIDPKKEVIQTIKSQGYIIK